MATKLIPGEFCWAELYTQNMENAVPFYQSLFGWQTKTVPIDTNQNYTFFNVGEKGIAGGFEINSEMKAHNFSPQWNSYILVEDIQKSVAKAKSLGAEVLKDVSDVMDMGKMAILTDPTGAIISLWQNLKPTANESLSKLTPGTIGWNELITSDIEKATEFYSKLFNWSPEVEEFQPGSTYTTFLNNGIPVAGMVKYMEGGAVGSRWSVYFTVDNIEESMNIAVDNGADICFAPIDIEGVGRFTMVRDPEEVFFSIMEFE